MSVGNFQGTAAAAANGSAKPGVPSRLRRWLHAAALLLIVVFAVQAETAAAITPPTADACPASGDPPIAPGTVRTHPGHWHNPKRSGTGWDFFYFGSNLEMLGYWYTYDTNGAPVWYVTSPITLSSPTSTWQGTLRRITLASNGALTDTAVGEIAGRLYPGATRRMGLRWSLSGSFANPPQECVFDLYSEASINTLESTTAFSGNWYDPLHSGWGYLYSMGRDATQYNEAEKLLIYDVTGKPVWLIALTNSTALPPDSVSARPLTYPKLRSGYTIATDCLDDPATTSVNECVDGYAGGSFSRTFTGAKTATISVASSVGANLGGRVNKAVTWPNPAVTFPGVPAQGIPPGVLTYPVTLTKTSLWTQVLVSTSHCEVPDTASTCTVYVGWSSDDTTNRLYRYNVLTGARDPVGSSATGYLPDALPPGSRVRYELRSGGATGALAFVSSEVLVSVGGADANTGPADAPPAPVSFQEPVLDTASDRVGALAATFKVNEGGAATYHVPIYAPRGSGGLTPEVSLSYASAGGEGLLGTGFTLNAVSSIQKCRSSKEAGDGDVVSSALDQFCLDGQRLLLWKGTHLTAGAEYRTEIESFQRIVLTATPSISAASLGLAQPVPTFAFTVYGKDGSARRFGDAAGTIVAPIHSNRGAAIAWLQTELRDVSDNVVHFTYSSQSGGWSALRGERTLTQISYSGGRLNFDYVTSGRRDISHSNIGDAQATQLLRGITVYGPSNEVLRRYAASYTNYVVGGLELVRPRVRRLMECADFAEQICYPATTFTWNDIAPAVDSGNSDHSPGSPGKIFKNLLSHRLGDFNGDGRVDIAWIDQGGRIGIAYSTANAAGITFDPLPAVVQVAGVDPAGAFQVFDLDADGYDDLIYLTVSATTPGRVAWYLRRSTGSNFAAAELLLDSVGPADATENFKYESSLADHTGDGLPDLVYRIGFDGNRIAVMQRDPANAARPFSFAAPLPVRLVDGDGSGPQSCALMTYTARRDQERAQVVDIDGDGRADLNFLSKSPECMFGTPIVSGPPPVEAPAQTPPAEEEPNTVVGYYTVSYRAEGIVTAGGVTEFRFVRGGRTVLVNAENTTTSAVQARQRVMTADINGDGYLDYVYLADSQKWRFNLTVGDKLDGLDGCVASCLLGANHIDKVQLLDYDGDGKLDFWWPDSSTSDRNYLVYLWKGDGFASTPISTGFIATAGNDWVRLSGDYDGDGQVDNLVVKPIDNGSADGGWSVRRSTSHHQPRGMITEIVNGLGARTRIGYSPLTFSSVYRRDYDGPLRTWGRGSAIYDLNGPNFVTQFVSSSAPTAGNPQNEAIVQYQYRGLKLQAGGRGSLGFGRVSTTDLQTLTSVDTVLHTDFPLNGLPQSTNTRRLSTPPPDACRNSSGQIVETAACFIRAPICPYGKLQACDASLHEPSALLVKGMFDSYGWRYQPDTPVANSAARTLYYYNQTMASVPPPGTVRVPPIFVARILSNTNEFEPNTGERTRFVAVKFSTDGYDDFGNVLRTTTLTRRHAMGGEGDDTNVTVELRNTYADYLSGWKLGRLASSVTFTTRDELRSGLSSVTTLGRRATFTYTDPLDTTDGRLMLHSERVEGLVGSSLAALVTDTAARGTITYYEHDSAGNRTGMFTCSADIAEQTCRNSGGHVFHPADQRVMRYLRTGYDGGQRYPQNTREAFSAGGDAAAEAVSSAVIARNGGGNELLTQDANGKYSYARYGVFGRKRFVYDQAGASSRIDHALCGAGNCPANLALAFVEITTTTGAPTRRVFHDLLGRPVVSQQEGLNAGDFVATLTRYDARGNVVEVSAPFFAVDAATGAATPKPGQSIVFTTTQYDALNRAYRVVAPDGAVTTKQYLTLRTVTTLPTNASGYAQTVTEDFTPQGEAAATIDAKGLLVKFSYAAGGELVRAERNGRATTSLYDTLGRKLSTSDPDTGTFTYTVNDAGETLSQTRARGNCTQSRYDGRGRLWQRTDYLGACGSGSVFASASWQFDTASFGRGQIASTQSSESGAVSVSRYYAYNNLGQPIEVRTDQGGRSYYQQQTFDQYGRSFQTFFTAPGVPTTGERTEYNARGYASRIRSAYPAGNGAIYYEAIEADPHGKIRRENSAVGAVLTTLREFDVRGRLKRQRVQGGGVPDAQDIGYDYDLAGNVIKRESTFSLDQTNVTLRETFAYDELQRLTGNSVYRNGVLTGGVSQVYDGEGNLLNRGGLAYVYAGVLTSPCLGEAGAAVPGPHAVSKVGGIEFCYDAGGNVIRATGTGDERRFSYTSYDKASAVRSSTTNTRTEFNYGAAREKVRRLDYAIMTATAPSSITDFVAGAEVRIVGSTIEEVVRYVGPVIVRQRRADVGYEIVRQYRVGDAQGSTDAVLDPWANAVNASAHMSFDPFGRRRDASTWTTATPWSGTLRAELEQTTRLGYTGHEQADEAGIVHMNGRIYDPRIGRFLQADPFVQAPRDSQSFNRYSYVFNNPMTYTDPSGYFGGKEQDGVRTGVAIVISVFLPQALIANGMNATYASIVTGAVAGGVQSGNARGAAVGALTAAAFVGIDAAFGVDPQVKWGGLSQGAYASRALSYGVAGGVLGVMQGGRFGHGFASAGFDTLLGPAKADGGENLFARGLGAAVVGGTTSAIAGGSFANGAMTAAFAFSVRAAYARAERASFDRRINAAMDRFAAANATLDTENMLALNTLPQGFVNFMAGAGDAAFGLVTFGFGDLAATRESLDVSGFVDLGADDYTSGANAGVYATGAAAFGQMTIRVGASTGMQLITRWSTAEATAAGVISEGQWVMLGGPSLRNWIFAGIARQYSFGSAVSAEVPAAALQWPRGWEFFKGVFGQRMYMP